MTKKSTEKKAMSAVQFSRKMNGIMSFMEGIASKTRESQEALMENSDPGIFDMNNLLDVSVQDDDTQPLLTMRKPKELTDADKAQIVEELAEVLKKMPGEVIDFSDIGPIATVIQTKLGFNQTLDGFINDLITGAADKQDSQSFAKGTEVPGVQDANSATDMGQGEVNKAPTDIAPPKATITDAPADTAIPAVDPMAAPAVDPMATPVDPMLGVDAPIEAPIEAPVDDLATQVGNELGDISLDVPEDAPEAPVADIDAPAPDADIDAPAPASDDIDMGEADLDIDLGDESVENPAEETKEEEKEEEKEDEKEEGEEEEDEGEEKELEAQLEAVRNTFLMKSRAQKIDALVESIKKKDTILEGISTKFHAKMNEESRNKEIKARLESIVANAKAEQKIQRILEGIAKKAKTEKCCDPKKAPAVAKIKKVVKPAAKLESDVKPELDALIESYRLSKSAKLESIDARKKAREVIENLTK